MFHWYRGLIHIEWVWNSQKYNILEHRLSDKIVYLLQSVIQALRSLASNIRTSSRKKIKLKQKVTQNYLSFIGLCLASLKSRVFRKFRKKLLWKQDKSIFFCSFVECILNACTFINNNRKKKCENREACDRFHSDFLQFIFIF